MTKQQQEEDRKEREREHIQVNVDEIEEMEAIERGELKRSLNE